ncbi:MAG: dephospho-CoA kinase [Acidimicrobiales bacterium]
MLAVGLTGGIGSGKSAVADRLVARGAVLIDADRVAREVVVPDGPAYRPLVERFGPGILAADGTVDRPALAAAAFGDPQALADLNAITHPAIGLAMIERRNALAGTDGIVVLAIPLLTAAHRETVGLDVVVVVDCPTEVALDRLVGARGMDRADAEARVAAQVSREKRLQDADAVVDNSSSLEHLAGEVDRLWAWLQERRRASGGSGGRGGYRGMGVRHRMPSRRAAPPRLE